MSGGPSTRGGTIGRHERQSSATTVVTQGSTVRLVGAPVGITFEGRLAADGNSIAGTFTQDRGPLPLTLVRASKETAQAGAAVCSARGKPAIRLAARRWTHAACRAAAPRSE